MAELHILCFEKAEANGRYLAMESSTPWEVACAKLRAVGGSGAGAVKRFTHHLDLLPFSTHKPLQKPCSKTLLPPIHTPQTQPLNPNLFPLPSSDRTFPSRLKSPTARRRTPCFSTTPRSDEISKFSFRKFGKFVEVRICVTCQRNIFRAPTSRKYVSPSCFF